MEETHRQLSALLAADPYTPICVKVADGRRIEVKTRDAAVLNSLALSVVEAPFSVTVIGLAQITEVSVLPTEP